MGVSWLGREVTFNSESLASDDSVLAGKPTR
jgi:hypothetical protein